MFHHENGGKIISIEKPPVGRGGDELEINDKFFKTKLLLNELRST